MSNNLYSKRSYLSQHQIEMIHYYCYLILPTSRSTVYDKTCWCLVETIWHCTDESPQGTCFEDKDYSRSTFSSRLVWVARLSHQPRLYCETSWKSLSIRVELTALIKPLWIRFAVCLLKVIAAHHRFTSLKLPTTSLLNFTIEFRLRTK